jgi:AraC family transcriptional regulator, regulatory protein of adaptative response / DNA-3-methyladenine glycosylase II
MGRRMVGVMDAILGLDTAALDRARISRDPRFDGKFFIAVTSTGIYCRPVCPVRSPKRSNIRYYATAAAAAEAGFRPCLRCRPEAAPGTPAWLGTSAVVRRALRLIDEGVLDEGSVDALAARVGIGSRHLHRLFVQHVGASPIAVAQTRRLHFAKRLLDETTLRITEIALAAGFGSVRRFNATFHEVYGRAPRDLRRRRNGRVPDAPQGHEASGAARANSARGRARPRDVTSGDEVILRLAFRPPYDWPSMRDALAASAVPGIERVDDRGYARTIASPCDAHAIIIVRPIAGEDALELRVRNAEPTTLFQLSATVRRMFDLAADPARIALAFESDATLAPLIARRPGLRISGVWDPFECAVRAVLGLQPISRRIHRLHRPDTARVRLARLVARVGRSIANADADAGIDVGLTHLFPTPSALAVADLSGLGLTRAQVIALRALARAIVTGVLDFSASVDDVVARLGVLPGFTRSLAQEVALRSLGEPDAFPSADLVLRRQAAASSLSARALASRAEAWRPWRGYAACHLWRAASDHYMSRAPAPRIDEHVRKRRERSTQRM